MAQAAGMRIVLLYPPPWKLSGPGHPPIQGGDGPPQGFRDGDMDADFLQIPYGLLTLAAQAMRAGHQVKVLNLSNFPWEQVERVIASLQAELWGMSCYTANRRGVGMVARSIRAHQPGCSILVGGPHASALPEQMLVHHPELDAVAIGEGELAFQAAIERLGRGEKPQGPGLAWREGARVVLGPACPRIGDLDGLAPVHEHFSSHLLMTSRGCPGQCSYCAKNAVWGKPWRAHSAAWVLDSIERAVARLPVKMLMLKDDTFTADRARTLEICRHLRDRKTPLLWSCDTRADTLDQELLKEMRLAGCQRVSLGVESGSASILKSIGKNLTPAKVVRATRLAREVGLQVRWFMMLGNRGETLATLRESLSLLREARPDQFIFACLSVYPGTRDFASLQQRGVLAPEVYFDGDFLELKMPFDASESDTEAMAQWFEANKGLRDLYQPSSADCLAVLERLGQHHAASLDLAAALYREGALEQATQHALRSVEQGLPTPGLAWNLLACIAARRHDPATMQRWLERALAEDPWHPVLQLNHTRLEAWKQGRGPLQLLARHDFQILERTLQPTLPGPLCEDFAVWPPDRPQGTAPYLGTGGI